MFISAVELIPVVILMKMNKLRFNTTAIFLVVVVLFLAFACNSPQHEQIGAVKNRMFLPKLHATDITTVISDSGITRYRISAPEWNVYDRAIQPYWEFPRGLIFERFDQNLKVDANIHCNYARFNENEKIWELKGNVKMTNIKGELFETQLVFWDQRMEKFYSDSLIKITQATHIITGIGFEANQTLTKYIIKKPQGIFPVDEKAQSPVVASQTIVNPRPSL